MTTIVKTFKNRRTATGLLKKLGRKPYEYDQFVQPTGEVFQVTLQDGEPVSRMAMLAATTQVAEALTQAAETVVEAVTQAQALVEAAAAEAPIAPLPESAEEREKRERKVRQLARKYAKLEERARKAKAPPPRKKKPKKPRVKKPRGVPTPRPPVLGEEAVATYAKAVKAKSVGPAILELYLAGRTTAEVWLIIKKRFKTPDDHKHYPSWYLCHYRRQGKLPTPEKQA